MHFQCRSFIGKTSPFAWSQYWENEPDDINITLTKGHLFGLIQLSSNDGSDLSSTGHHIIDLINAAYYSSATSDIAQALTVAVSQASSHAAQSGITLSLTLAVVCHTTLHLHTHGNTSVSLVRHNKVASLINALSDQPKSVSGAIQDLDKVFIYTQDFINKLSWDAVKHALAQPKLQTLEEDILSLLYSSEATAESSAILIEIFTDDEPSLAIIPPTPQPAISPPPVVTPQPQISIAPPPPPVSPPVMTIPSPKSVASKPNIFKTLFNRRASNPQVSLSTEVSPTLRRRRKFNVFISVLLLIGLTASVYLGNQQRLLHERQDKFNQLKQTLEEKLTSADQVRSLNLKTAQDLAKQAQATLKEMEAVGLTNENLDSYKTRINQLLSQTGAETEIGPQVLYDTTLIFKDVKYSTMILSGNYFYLLDKSRNLIDQLEISNKSHKTISKSDTISGLSGFTDNNGKLYGFDSKSVYLISSEKLESQFDLSKISSNIKIPAFGAWNGSLYLLDTQAQNIWKLTPNNTGFSHAAWLKDGQKINSTANSIAINGKLWVLSSDGTITPYLRGSAENFKKPADLDTGSAKNLVTTPEGEYLAFNDDKNIVYIYKKNGDSKAQYNFGNRQILSLAIAPDASKLYILASDAKIYLININ